MCSIASRVGQGSLSPLSGAFPYIYMPRFPGFTPRAKYMSPLSGALSLVDLPIPGVTDGLRGLKHFPQNSGDPSTRLRLRLRLRRHKSLARDDNRGRVIVRARRPHHKTRGNQSRIEGAPQASKRSRARVRSSSSPRRANAPPLQPALEPLEDLNRRIEVFARRLVIAPRSVQLPPRLEAHRLPVRHVGFAGGFEGRLETVPGFVELAGGDEGLADWGRGNLLPSVLPSFLNRFAGISDLPHSR